MASNDLKIIGIFQKNKFPPQIKENSRIRNPRDFGKSEAEIVPDYRGYTVLLFVIILFVPKSKAKVEDENYSNTLESPYTRLVEKERIS